MTARAQAIDHARADADNALVALHVAERDLRKAVADVNLAIAKLESILLAEPAR